MPVDRLALYISTHAPTEGSDSPSPLTRAMLLAFQPTLPPKGATCGLSRYVWTDGFQPTLPPKGATSCATGSHKAQINFNPRSHRRERRACLTFSYRIYTISTHAPTEGSDRSPLVFGCIVFYFNPRSHRRERRSRGAKRELGQQEFQPTLPPKGATCCGVNL